MKTVVLNITFKSIKHDKGVKIKSDIRNLHESSAKNYFTTVCMTNDLNQAKTCQAKSQLKFK